MQSPGSTASTTSATFVDVALFFVAPEHMPRGIGTILWGHLIRQAQRLGADTVTIGSDPHAVGF